MSASLIGRLVSSAFQAVQCCSVDVARGLALLFGIGTKATMQTLVSLTDTSSPAKWSMLRFSF
jgi:hypothetical protein